ncbi:unnamed protein product [Gordionus sp. m RMFG-2023]
MDDQGLDIIYVAHEEEAAEYWNDTLNPMKQWTSNLQENQSIVKHYGTEGGRSAAKINAALTIYFIGYGLSIICLSTAFFILLSYKKLRCSRNKIHSHLIMSFLLSEICWLLFYEVFRHRTAKAGHKIISISQLLAELKQPYQPRPYHLSKISICNTLSTFYIYFHTTTFFWMFVEGVYLYQVLIIDIPGKVFSMKYYYIIGWGLPFAFAVIWYLTNKIMYHHACVLILKINLLHYIYVVPIFIVLLINIYILAKILKLMVDKIYSKSERRTHNCFKFVKGFFCLSTILGASYITTLYTPSHSHKTILSSYVLPFLISTQGILVSLYCCFSNHEVKAVIWKHLKSCRESKCLCPSCRSRLSIDPLKNSKIDSPDYHPIVHHGSIGSATTEEQKGCALIPLLARRIHHSDKNKNSKQKFAKSNKDKHSINIIINPAFPTNIKLVIEGSEEN